MMTLLEQAVPTLEQVERNHILRVYALTQRNKQRTAQLLGISLKTLYNKLGRYESTSTDAVLFPQHEGSSEGRFCSRIEQVDAGVT